jgi:hypothetical protein
LASFAAFSGKDVSDGEGPGSENMLAVLKGTLGRSQEGVLYCTA